MKHKLLSILAISLSLLACNSDKKAKSMSEETKVTIAPISSEDPHSYAKPNEVVVKHLDWTANVDFDSSRITATARWTIENKTGAKEVYFDTRGLFIDYVTIGNNDEFTTFRLEPEVLYVGQKLIVDITPKTDVVRIYYRTTDKSDALQWLTKEQTGRSKRESLN